MNPTTLHFESPIARRLRAAGLAAMTALLFATGLGAQAERQRFIPAPGEPGKGNSADFTALHHLAEDDSDIFMLMAHAGIGDSFPVQEEGKPKAFDVKVIAGNDDKLEIECTSDGKKVLERIGLERDGWHALPQGEYQYQISYPSVTVAANGSVTTSKALIIVRRLPLNSAFASSPGKGARLYSMRFHGSSLLMLQETLQRAFPKDNVVLSVAAEGVRLPNFELRDVRLAELARTIEFLSDGNLSVEVVEKDADMPGNIWRIAYKTPASAVTPVKMRSVAAPHLFADEKGLAAFQTDAVEMEQQRAELARKVSLVSRNEPGHVVPTKMQTLSSQKVFVLIGSEDGVAGMESFIKAAEQRAAEEAAAKEARAATISPKMRAVAAPHLFASKERLDRFMEEALRTKEKWLELTVDLRKEMGLRSEPLFYPVEIEPRAERKVFVLLGTEQSIAGLESLIDAAERLAADEDARTAALEAELKAADERARLKNERAQ